MSMYVSYIMLCNCNLFRVHELYCTVYILYCILCARAMCKRPSNLLANEINLNACMRVYECILYYVFDNGFKRCANRS